MDNILDSTVERVKFFIKFKKISLRKFAEIIGVSHSLINNTKSLGSDKLESILSNYPEINPIWLLTGKGEMLVDYSHDEFADETVKTGSIALNNEMQLLKEMNLLLQASLTDKERLIKLLEEDNHRLSKR
ncbi:helix-turn-helix domain-containing protein [Flavobacterium sp. NKUCC04_CG]|uniref:helix-turn-helix domain-containing protein n=1 Tax=Flavobacterium sp. NKUCC04_CG TaxID=2842121 RepID=UPI001C5B2338|nr:helix-turn-helix domain-containing protein [Flavobacterium sp. NKUCC04_CG]MBW3518574.1 helix-turn-helix domain-containing protein [Flavobacterium sp. NKUCC04_CG]